MNVNVELAKMDLEFNCNEPVNITNIKPNNVLVKMTKDTFAKTSSGLILSANGSDKPDKLNVGRIVGVGEGVSSCWKPGSIVAFSKYGGIPIPLTLYPGDDNEYILTDDSSLFFSFYQELPDELKPERSRV